VTKLIYHKVKENKGGISPFDLAIIKLVKNQRIKITSPYISIEYLNKMIRLATDWQLISDIDKWIESNNKTEREKIKSFIIKNKTKIHHCPELHAKTIITDKAVLLGSANFTEKGLKTNNEVSVILTEDAEIKELSDWFNNWWDTTDEPDTNELNTIINELSKQKQVSETIKKLTSNAYRIKTIFAPSLTNFTEIEAIIRDRSGKNDKKISYEIRIDIKYENSLGLKNKKNIDINLRINKTLYIAGLNITRVDKYIWISPSVKNPENKKVSLVDLMLANGYNKNDKITLHYYQDENTIEIKKR